MLFKYNFGQWVEFSELENTLSVKGAARKVWIQKYETTCNINAEARSQSDTSD